MFSHGNGTCQVTLAFGSKYTWCFPCWIFMESFKIFGGGRFSRSSNCSLCPFSSVFSLLPTTSSLLFLAPLKQTHSLALHNWEHSLAPCVTNSFVQVFLVGRLPCPFPPPELLLSPTFGCCFILKSLGDSESAKCLLKNLYLKTQAGGLPLETEARKPTFPGHPISAGAWAFRRQPWLGRAATKPSCLGEEKSAVCPQGWIFVYYWDAIFRS